MSDEPNEKRIVWEEEVIEPDGPYSVPHSETTKIEDSKPTVMDVMTKPGVIEDMPAIAMAEPEFEEEPAPIGHSGANHYPFFEATRSFETFKLLMGFQRTEGFHKLKLEDRNLEAFKLLPKDDRWRCLVFLSNNEYKLKAFELVPEIDRIRCFRYLKSDDRWHCLKLLNDEDKLEALELVPEDDRWRCLGFLKDEDKLKAFKLLPEDEKRRWRSSKFFEDKGRIETELAKKIESVNLSGAGDRWHNLKFLKDEDRLSEFKFVPEDKKWYYLRFLKDEDKLEALKLVPERDKWRCLKFLKDEDKLEVFRSIQYSCDRIKCFSDLSLDKRAEYLSLLSYENELEGFKLVPPFFRFKCFSKLQPRYRNFETFSLLPESSRADRFSDLDFDSKNLETFKLVPEKDRRFCFYALSPKYKAQAFKLLPPNDRVLCFSDLEPNDRMNVFELVPPWERADLFKELNEEDRTIELLKLVPKDKRKQCSKFLRFEDKLKLLGKNMDKQSGGLEQLKKAGRKLKNKTRIALSTIKKMRNKADINSVTGSKVEKSDKEKGGNKMI